MIITSSQLRECKNCQKFYPVELEVSTEKNVKVRHHYCSKECARAHKAKKQPVFTRRKRK